MNKLNARYYFDIVNGWPKHTGRETFPFLIKVIRIRPVSLFLTAFKFLMLSSWICVKFVLKLFTNHNLWILVSCKGSFTCNEKDLDQAPLLWQNKPVQSNTANLGELVKSRLISPSSTSSYWYRKKKWRSPTLTATSTQF